MKDPVIRYRIDICTDEFLRYFAQIETFKEGFPLPSVRWTKTCETWSEALDNASKIIGQERNTGPKP